MSGICAGRRGEVSLGDVIVASSFQDVGGQRLPIQTPQEPD
jgi:nucleoside phosphorylase